MFRYVGLTSAECLHDLVDRQGPLLEKLQETQAAGLSQDLESSGYNFDHFAVNHGRWPLRLKRKNR